MSRHDPENKRIVARDSGNATYNTGLPCINGHFAHRYTATTICVECKKETFRKQYLNNKDRWLSYYKKWYAENREYVTNKASKYREAFPEKVKETLKKYRELHKEDHCSRERIRAMRKRNAAPVWLSEDQKGIIEHIYNCAKALTKVSGIKMAVDHIVPLKGKTVCGLHVPWNLRVIDVVSNSKKHSNLTNSAYLPVFYDDSVLVAEGALPWNWRKL